MRPVVSVVVPFYNEQDNVPILREEIAAAFAHVPRYDYECVFVDDGSSDATGAVLQRLASEDTCVRPVFFRENCGQSAALMAGLREARGDYLVTLDGDLQNDPADIPRILELLESYDCVCGIRVNRRDTWVRKVSSRVANGIRNGFLRDGIRDTGCGLKGFRKHCVDSLVCFNGVHRFFPVLIRRSGFNIVECPVNHRERRFGASKYGIHNRLWRGLFDLIGVAWLRRRMVTYSIAPIPAAVRSDSKEDHHHSAEMPAASLPQDP